MFQPRGQSLQSSELRSSQATMRSKHSPLGTVPEFSLPLASLHKLPGCFSQHSSAGMPTISVPPGLPVASGSPKWRHRPPGPLEKSAPPEESDCDPMASHGPEPARCCMEGDHSNFPHFCHSEPWQTHGPTTQRYTPGRPLTALQLPIPPHKHDVILSILK